ncbi:hypothetical protein S245_034034, partial [Arachis hypogaea]
WCQFALGNFPVLELKFGSLIPNIQLKEVSIFNSKSLQHESLCSDEYTESDIQGSNVKIRTPIYAGNSVILKKLSETNILNVYLQVFARMTPYVLGKASCMCRKWRYTIRNPMFWRVACMKAWQLSGVVENYRILQSKYNGSWRKMWLSRPRLQTNAKNNNLLLGNYQLVAAQAFPAPEVISDILNGNWDHERTEFSLPPLMTLLLGEPGTGSSSTPSMQAQIKKWIEQASEPNKEVVIKALLGAKEAMLGIRYHMRLMGEAAGVPNITTLSLQFMQIEPESQTKLLDATLNFEGVLLAGVPGAGGFDAVFAVTLGDSSSNVTKTWSSLNVLALL